MVKNERLNNWIEVATGKIFTTLTGATPSKKNANFYGGDIPLIKPPELNATLIYSSSDTLTEEGYQQARALPIDSVLVSCIGNLGKVGINKIPAAFNQQINAIFPDERIAYPKFIFYQVQSHSYRTSLTRLASATTISIVNRKKFDSIKLCLAPLNEQRRIVEKIDQLFAELDQGEAALRQTLTLLKRYRQSLLKAAVTGELTADWRREHQGDAETGQQLLERILRARREHWEAEQLAKFEAKGKPPKTDAWKKKYKQPAQPDTTDLPELPGGWVWATVDQAVSVFRNGLSKKPTNESNDYPILRISSVRALEVSLDDIRYYQDTDDANIQNSWVENGDLLFTRYNGSRHLVGVCGLMRHDRHVLHPDKLIKARPLPDGFVVPEFLEIAWNCGASRNHIESHIKTTSGQQGIAGRDIKDAPFPLPPLNEQRQIVERINEALAEQAQLETHCQTELARAKALRQSILKDAFAGKLVPQDPNDEPASELLARIQAERKAAKSNKRRKK